MTPRLILADSRCGPPGAHVSGKQRAVQRDDVGAREQLGQLDVAGTELAHSLARERVAGQHAHAEAVQDADHRRADDAGADHPHGAAVQVEAEQAVEREVAVAHALVGAVDLAVEGQDEGHGMLGDGVRRVGRHAHHPQAERRRRGQVDVVEAGRAQGDQLHAARGERLERNAPELVVDERADHRGAGPQSGAVSDDSRGSKNTSSWPSSPLAALKNSRSYRRALKTAMPITCGGVQGPSSRGPPTVPRETLAPINYETPYIIL